MRNKNMHSRSIPEEVLEQVMAKDGEIKALLAPYMCPLTPSDRQEIPKMGPKTLYFVEKAHEFAALKPHLVPPYLNMADFDADFADARGLWELSNKAKDLESMIADTQMLAGSEAFMAALIFYNSVKVAAAQNVPGAKTVYEDLKKRFPQGKKRAPGKDAK